MVSARWTLGNKSIIHIRRGQRGQCVRPGGHCRNEDGRYLDDVNVPRFRYEDETAGAHYAPKEKGDAT